LRQCRFSFEQIAVSIGGIPIERQSEPTGQKVRRVRRPRAEPEAVDLRTSAAGLRAVAVFEAAKGLGAILLAVGLLSLLHKDVEQIAENLLSHLHIAEESHLSQAFLRLADRMTDARLWAVSGGALAYAAVRLTEAYGLWHRRVWAEWFALLSGTLYLPLEIYQVSQHPSIFHYVVFVGNVAIVLYMLWVRVSACWPPSECPEPERG
jgi:uncharacterized membrane protein (DUF2068 family)